MMPNVAYNESMLVRKVSSDSLGTKGERGGVLNRTQYISKTAANQEVL